MEFRYVPMFVTQGVTLKSDGKFFKEAVHYSFAFKPVLFRSTKPSAINDSVIFSPELSAERKQKTSSQAVFIVKCIINLTP